MKEIFEEEVQFEPIASSTDNDHNGKLLAIWLCMASLNALNQVLEQSWVKVYDAETDTEFCPYTGHVL